MKKFTALFSVFALVAVLAVSCRTEKATIAKITVLDQATLIPIGGATVRLYGEQSDTLPHPPIDIDRTADTDGSGIASFTFTEDYKLGQAGFAVLTVDVTRNGVTHTSIAVIKIEEEKTNELTVKIP